MGKSKPQVQTTTSTIPAQYQKQWDELANMAGGIADSRFNYDPNQRIAGLSPGEIQAMGGLQGLAQLNPAGQEGMDLIRSLQYADPASANFNSANLGGEGSMWDRMMGADPIAVAAGRAREAQRSEVRDVAAQQGSEFMGAYRNPYEDQVVQATLADINRQGEMAQDANASAAAAAGAFGGSRHGVVEAETNRALIDQSRQAASALRHQGFTTAANLGMTDANRTLQAGGMNQGADVSVAGLAQNARIANAANTTQANIAAANLNAQREAQMLGIESQYGMFNAGQENTMNMFNAGQENQVNLANTGYQLNAGLGLGNLGIQSRGQQMDLYNNIGAWGTAQRGIDQARADFAYNQPMDLASWRAGILGARPTPTTTTSTVPTERNRAAGALGGAASGAQIGSAFGPWGTGIGAVAGGLIGAFF